MSERNLHINSLRLANNNSSVEGEYVTIEGDTFYKIRNYDQMEPFFMSLVSHSDHWMFISSNGGLSAGRRNEDNALFPYYTEDKITQTAHVTGARTILRVILGDQLKLWEPFSDRYSGAYQVSRNLYKSRWGNQLIFEEINEDLKLTFRCCWKFSELYGFVRKCTLLNQGLANQSVELLDGIQNILPYGITSHMQNNRSNLANAYKRSELHTNTGLGIFALSAMIVDRAEASEALKATTVWSSGLHFDKYLLSSKQLSDFSQGESIQSEVDIKAQPGAYFGSATLELSAGEEQQWYIVAEINQSHADIHDLLSALKNSDQLVEALEKDVEAGTDMLRRLVGKADGLQLSADQSGISRHYANVLFNIMRGGIFEDQYQLDLADFKAYLQQVNTLLYKDQQSFFSKLEEPLTYTQLIDRARACKHPDVLRVCYEYLPLSFSRRHGDPSRPWNRFSIDLTDMNGEKSRSYQGNWRDIFQNWEALAYSFPEFVLGMIFKFLNASTIDGYNPYRISRSGIDWEVVEPDDPWTYIGYWGDHQLIYLLRLLELSKKHHPEQLHALMNEQLFVYADVPYRIRSYNEIVADPQNTVDYSQNLAKVVDKRAEEFGSDGKLVHNQNGGLIHASFIEKICVTWLTKLYNLIPDAGIWLNTQRPEWNDANNALVGNGTSMVTLYYMRRFTKFFIDLFQSQPKESLLIHKEVAGLISDAQDVLQKHKELLDSGFDPTSRRSFTDQMGRAGEKYRNSAYLAFSEVTQVSVKSVQDLFDLALKYIDASIDHNQRVDNLYHAYNLVSFDQNGIEVDHLYEMLEGQVAVLSSGYLNGEQSLKVLDALKASAMFRADQYSYLLYPNRELPGFLDKNVVPASFLGQSKLIQLMLEANDSRLMEQDQEGQLYFNGDIHNARDIEAILHKLTEEYDTDLINQERQQLLDLFEQMYNHRAFTGRSGTFFAYEGLGSIYWHMVSKLLLASQETIYNKASQLSAEQKGRLIEHYYEIRAGIGINKSPELYGAFPTDPYSHTPFHRGAQQPGMTGQVKEDIINRWAELGVQVDNGCISFKPEFLNPEEFMKKSAVYEYYNVKGEKVEIELQKDQLAFTYCQIPVVYTKSSVEGIELINVDGQVVQQQSLTLEVHVSAEIFKRSGLVKEIHVQLKS